MLERYHQVCQRLEMYADAHDLDKYYDVYELSREDVRATEQSWDTHGLNTPSLNSLQDIELPFETLHIVTRMLLCILLALDAEGGRKECATWTIVIEALTHISMVNARKVNTLHQALGNEEGRSPTFYQNDADTDCSRHGFSTRIKE